MKDTLRNALFAVAAIAMGLIPVFASTPSPIAHTSAQLEQVRGT